MRLKSSIRYELKYLITWRQRDEMMGSLLTHMTPDTYGNHDGEYTITSLYYDSPDYCGYWEKIEGEKLRRKVRLRTYGKQLVRPETECFLEIKERQNKTLSKRRVQVAYQDAFSLSGLPMISERLDDEGNAEGSAVIDEVQYLYHIRQLRPACVVRYNRLALNGGADYPDLRVTFDTELRGRTHDLTLLSTGHADEIHFLPPEMCVLEIKANHNVPYWLAQLVTHHGCTMRRISKYCITLETCLQLASRQKIQI